MRTPRIIVIGAGMGGLSAALKLARKGFAVTVLERAATPGGKMRQAAIAGRAIDTGPTVLTMRWVFDVILDEAGTSLDRELVLTPLDCLARHAWKSNERLDLYHDRARSADAIRAFSNRDNAEGYLKFSERAALVYRTLEASFIRASKPTPVSLSMTAGIKGLGDLWKISPFTTLWKMLSSYFSDPRLRQLFGRYATYCGSSPYLAPATLMLVAHVEQEGVWSVEGGMQAIANAMTRLVEKHGGDVRFNADVARIEAVSSGVTGVILENGERLPADAIVFNGDSAALGAGLLGDAVRSSTPSQKRANRSLSAVTWSLVANTKGFPLTRHNVFFSNNYEAEFDDILKRNRLPTEPTVYICAEDRLDDRPWEGPERLLCLVNAPASGDVTPLREREISQCRDRMTSVLTRAGLEITDVMGEEVSTPELFNRRFPATGGALYGQASHGWTASFQRPEARTRIPGLYLAGGSVHPGPGVPMAAISGWLAAATLTEDLASPSKSRAVVMPGGT